jgi:hypothetical protein
MADQIGTIRCGAFSAIPIGYNRWAIVCDWMADFRHEVDCVRDTAARLVIQIQAENRRPKVVARSA